MRNLATLGAATALFLAACGDGGSSSNALDIPDPTARPGITTNTAHDQHGGGAADCSPSGTTLAITASNIAFNVSCLAAPANQPVTITIDNKDSGIPHGLTVLASHSAPDFFAQLPIFAGPGTKTLTVKGLPAGTYAFHCQQHAGTMLGTFVVK